MGCLPKFSELRSCLRGCDAREPVGAAAQKRLSRASKPAGHPAGIKACRESAEDQSLPGSKPGIKACRRSKPAGDQSPRLRPAARESDGKQLGVCWESDSGTCQGSRELLGSLLGKRFRSRYVTRSIVVGFSAFPPRRRRFPDAPSPPHRRGRSRVVAAASCRRSGCRRPPVHPGVVSAPPSPAVARAARPPSSRLSPLRRRVIAAASSSSRPKPTVERSSVAAERPLAVARRPRLVARPPATRRPCRFIGCY